MEGVGLAAVGVVAGVQDAIVHVPGGFVDLVRVAVVHVNVAMGAHAPVEGDLAAVGGHGGDHVAGLLGALGQALDDLDLRLGRGVHEAQAVFVAAVHVLDEAGGVQELSADSAGGANNKQTHDRGPFKLTR